MDVLVIGIAGGTGSGKTTIVRQILAQLPEGAAVVIPQDNYYKDNGHLPIAKRHELNFDHPSSIEWPLLVSHLEKLRQGLTVQMPQYSYLTCTRQDEFIPLAPHPVLIVEGILCLSNKELRERQDIKVFVDAPADDRLLRCIRRDIEERGRTLPAVQERYYKTVKPMHTRFIEPSKAYADIIIPNDRRNQVAMEMIVARIKMHLINSKEKETTQEEA